MYESLVRSAKDVGVSHRCKSSCTRTRDHWLSGQPETGDRENFQVGEKWFKPNYHAHIVFDWMNHDTGKSRKLNDEDMTEIQSLASDILLMERG